MASYVCLGAACKNPHVVEESPSYPYIIHVGRVRIVEAPMSRYRPAFLTTIRYLNAICSNQRPAKIANRRTWPIDFSMGYSRRVAILADPMLEPIDFRNWGGGDLHISEF